MHDTKQNAFAAKELQMKEQLRLEWQARVDAQNVSAAEADRLSSEHVQLEKLYEETRIRLDEVQKIMWEKEVQAEKHQSMVWNLRPEHEAIQWYLNAMSTLAWQSNPILQCFGLQYWSVTTFSTQG